MDNKPNYKRTRRACYSAYFTMSSIFCVPPLLFVTFHEDYGVSYTLLGTLVLINFFTQLAIDLAFTVFSKHFNPKLLVRIMPLITSLGLFIYAIVPWVAPDMAYLGLAVGTVIFSVAAGLSEVLLSPTIAAMPSENPQRDMSLLHSLYAFGVFIMVVFSTLFLRIFGEDSWTYLMLILAALPIISAVLFMISPMPDMSGGGTEVRIQKSKKRTVALALCVMCIFFGSCAESSMTTWISGYMENVLGIEKAVGDILGVATFAILLGLARILYARFGKSICRVLLISMIGSIVCYLAVGLSSSIAVAFIGCILTGFTTSMLWPGTLIMMEENIPATGVATFALMAAGGDLGASVSPQLVGIVIDGVAASELAVKIGELTGMTPDQIGLRSGMLISAIFPIIGCLVVIIITRFFKKNRDALTVK